MMNCRTKGASLASAVGPTATALAIATLANLGTAATAIAQDAEPTITVQQEAGKIVYWVLPGPRQLSETTFGTAENPKTTLQPKLQEAKEMAEAGTIPPTVPQLLQDLPILVGVPEQAREEGPDGNLWLNQPNPFSDMAEIVQGSFTTQLWDNVETDPPGPPGETTDRATMTAEFTDPAGNEYRAELDHVVKPPFPGYETGGGVVVDTTLHGTTGTGTPLMPEVETLAAWWGVGDLYVNGELAEQGRVMHLMTTEVVRDKDYHLALQEEMPLAPEERLIRDQEHHTHLIVMPIKGTEEGPVFEPVPTAFELPNGEMQPFIHVMYEEDTVAQGVETRTNDAAADEEAGPAAIVEMTDSLSFSPETVTIKAGETVLWRNTSNVPHTVTADRDEVSDPQNMHLPEGAEPFNSGMLDRGAEWSHTFDVPGRYKYFCIPHEAAGMIGEVIVEE